MSDDVARANRVAAELVAEHGVPGSYDDLADLIAVAYLRGTLDSTVRLNETLRGALIGGEGT